MRREERGVSSHPVEDPWRTGFIGVEWSSITTTLAPLSAKRTAADPLWGVYAARQFRGLGLGKGDSVVLLSSSSFPGLVFSLLAAADTMGLKVLWIHSLGSSTWGANRLDFSWPVLATVLRTEGFLTRKADLYTLGGREGIGLDISPEGRTLLMKSAGEEGVPIFTAPTLGELIDAQMERILSWTPRLLITVGGGSSLFGEGGGERESPQGGYYEPGAREWAPFCGGVAERSLREGIPVLHFLNLRTMGALVGIPYDGEPSPRFRPVGGGAWSAAGLVLYCAVLFLHRRWERKET